MALRSFDSQTRLGIPRPSKSVRALADHQGEQFADEGTLIMEAPSFTVSAPISVAPSRHATIPPPPPSSVRPVMYSVPPPSSVRPAMPSWDDRSGWAPPNEITKSTRIPPKRKLTTSERSASAMILIASAAMLAALAAVGFMHKAERGTAAPVVAAQVSAPKASPAPAPAPPPPPVAEDLGCEFDVPAPSAPAPATKPLAPVAKPVAVPTAVAAAPVTTAVPVAKPVKEPKPKAPANAAQQQALEDLLEQLGEEQLKR